jgi:hypothetical protein
VTTREGPPGPTIFLHIGTPKSGTTYLQSRFTKSYQQAAEQGLLWPGPRWGTHVEAVRDLRTLEPGQRPDPQGPWMALAKAAREWPGERVLISMEWLAGSTPYQVMTAVRTLQPNRVEVICTARDLLRSFVAQWQEMTKNCRPWSWREFVDEMLADGPGPAHERFWNQQDLPEILEKWSTDVPRDRVHLVTLPQSRSDPELLWKRFCSVLGIDGSSFEEPQRDNESLGVVSAELMHRVNIAAIAKDVTHEEYQKVFHWSLADQILAPRRGDEQPIAVSAEVDAWIRRRAERLVEDTRDLGIDVVGDLADLVPGPRLDGREPDDVSDAELLETAIDALASLGLAQFKSLQQARTRNQDLRRQLTRLRDRTGAAGNPAAERRKGRRDADS